MADADVRSSLPHLILVGLPGVGKTTIGRAAARKLGREFLDFDQEIERRQGLGVREIFRLKGEEHFRELEFALTKELSTKGGMVLSPGGGWITQPRSVELLRSTGRIIYLRASPEAVARRLRRVETRAALGRTRPSGSTPGTVREEAALRDSRYRTRYGKACTITTYSEGRRAVFGDEITTNANGRKNTGQTHSALWARTSGAIRPRGVGSSAPLNGSGAINGLELEHHRASPDAVRGGGSRSTTCADCSRNWAGRFVRKRRQQYALNGESQDS